MNESNPVYAVLTGDLIQSSTLAPEDLQAVMQALREAAGRFAERFPSSILGKLDIYSGDGWQLLMPEWKLSLRAALYLRATVKAQGKMQADTRVAIAWGGVDRTTLDPEHVSRSTGEAFTSSGRALDKLAEGQRSLILASPLSDSDGFLACAVALLDEIVKRWTAAQARSLTWMLLGLTQEEVAQRTGRVQSTVSEALAASGWRSIMGFMMALENRQ